MEKRSVRQFSLLGLALMGVSALTAAFTTSNAAPQNPNTANNGTLRNFSGGNGAIQVIDSCITAVQAVSCHKTALGPGLLGTNTGAATVYVNALGQRFTTQGNTSHTIANNGVDTTSVLIPAP